MFRNTRKSAGLVLPVLVMALGASSAHAGADCTSGAEAKPSCRLIEAVHAADLEGVKKAIAQGADIDVRDDGGAPLLVIAFTLPDPRTEEGKPARVSKRLKVARYLLDRGIDVTATDSNGVTALHQAGADARLIDFVEPLIEKGADPDAAVGHFRETPLILALDTGNHAGAEKLLKAGADVDKPLLEGITPLLFAVLKGDADGVSLVLKHGADIDAPNDFGMTPLAMAIRLGRLDEIDVLVREGADPDIKIDDRVTPRELAQEQAESIRRAFQKAAARYGKGARTGK